MRKEAVYILEELLCKNEIIIMKNERISGTMPINAVQDLILEVGLGIAQQYSELITEMEGKQSIKLYIHVDRHLYKRKVQETLFSSDCVKEQEQKAKTLSGNEFERKCASRFKNIGGNTKYLNSCVRQSSYQENWAKSFYY